MRCVIVMFDSLNRHLLAPYGCDVSHTPNFARLARKACTFDTSYVCSMPCMPARRDLHTGRPNFMHRSWGPLEPFDASVFQQLRDHAGVHSHLVTDHQHYWEDGGLTYHNRYSTYDFIRGQEGDPWKGRVGDIDDLLPESGAIGRHKLAESSERFSRQDLINRTVWQHDDAQRPVNRTFSGGLEFIRDNAGEDNWLLQIETFDPHEPFDAPDWARDLAAEHFDGYDGPHYDWPVYNYADEQATPEQIEHLRQNYMALLAACDAQLGRVLRAFDQLDHWKDTALIVCTDHGFFLGERNFVGKMWVPWWEPLARTPLFVHDPRVPSADGQRRSALVQPMLDIGPTLCDMFGQDASALLPHATGRSLRPVLEDDTPIRTTAMFGTFGQQANVTDGRHVYMRAANGERPPEYTLMPTQMRQRFDPAKFANDQVRMAGPFDFTQDAQVMRIPDSVILGGTPGHPDRQRTRLYDLQQDPTQSQSIDDPAIEQRMEQHLVDLMRECDAPTEQYDRFGLRR